MFTKSITLFRMFGFAVRIDISWLVILVLVVWSLAGGVFPQRYPGLTRAAYFAMGLVGALALFASIVFHELSHSLVARRFGLPIRGITLFLFGGVAEMTEEPESPKVEFFMAVAGPVSSLVLAAAAWAAASLGAALGWPKVVTVVLAWVAFINAALAVFNLIPGFPLDGGRVLRSILWHFKGDLRRATGIASTVGSAFGMFLIVLGFLNLLLGNPFGGLWFILIGMFLRGAARQSYRQVIIREYLEGEPVSRFMNAEPVSVGPSTTLAELVEHYVYRYHFKMFPVVDGGRLVGCITTRQVKDIPRDQWPLRTVGEVVSSCSAENTIPPDGDAVKALAKMSRSENSRLMVVDDGRLVGILTLKDLLRFLALKIELESGRGSGAAMPTDASL